MKLEMKVDEIFVLDSKTIFSGALETSSKSVSNIECLLKVEDKIIAEILIRGEVHNRSGHRDLWTDDAVPLRQDQITTHTVILVSK